MFSLPINIEKPVKFLCEIVARNISLPVSPKILFVGLKSSKKRDILVKYEIKSFTIYN